MRPLEKLASLLEGFPGVGRRSAERFAYHILFMPERDAKAFAEAVAELRRGMRRCEACGNYDERNPCGICSDAGRERGVLCLVEHPGAIRLIEKSGVYRGLYHVISAPAEGSRQRYKPLLERIRQGQFTEILIATGATAEGEVVAAQAARLLKPLGLRVTRIGMGLPAGADMETTEEGTLRRALEGRREM